MESDTTKWERMRNYYDSVRHPEGECDTCDEYRELCERLAPTFYDNLAAARAEAERWKKAREESEATIAEIVRAAGPRAERDDIIDCVTRLRARLAELEKPADGSTREFLGRIVRMVWVEWAKAQESPKPSWLLPWDELPEPMREVDRRIGERVASVALPLWSDDRARLDAAEGMEKALEEWRRTPFFETENEWATWIARFRPRVDVALAAWRAAGGEENRV